MLSNPAAPVVCLQGSEPVWGPLMVPLVRDLDLSINLTLLSP